jgi:hypothetical protein
MTIKAGCHCGATQFEAPEPTALISCTCSYCDRVGALWAYCKPEELKLKTARDRVSTYQFGSYLVEHHHCAICGCSTWGQSPDFSKGAPDFEHPRVGWNVRMARDFDRSDLEVTVLDGRNLW